LVAAGLGACGGDSAEEGDPAAEERAAAEARPPARKTVTVKIADFKFKPPTVSVKVGGTISFVSADKAPHTAQTDLDSKAAEFDTGRLEKGQKKVVTVRNSGRFDYFCAYHRFMEGNVRVEE
jgi:plastocyanin